MSPNLLRGSSVYLIGAIDHADDPRAWRRRITKELLHPLGIKVYDPMVKPGWLPESARITPKNYNEAIAAALNGHVNPQTEELYHNGIQMVRKIDLRFIHDCSFVICSLPKRFTAGTFEELSVAADAGKPILLYMPDGVCSTWIPAQVASSLLEYTTEVHFESWEKLYDYIRGVDAGIVDVDKYKWIFMSYWADELVQKIQLENED